MMKMSRSQSLLVQSPHRPGQSVRAGLNLSSDQLTERMSQASQATNITYTASTADIPQNSTLRLSTRLGADEARTAFNEDQVIKVIEIISFSYSDIACNK